MIFLTEQERRVIIFVSLAVFAGLLSDLCLKGDWAKSPFLHILDDPSFYPRVNVNRASLEDLLAVPRMTPDIAKKILGYRRDHGVFRSLEELKNVLNFGESRWKRAAQQLKVD